MNNENFKKDKDKFIKDDYKQLIANKDYLEQGTNVDVAFDCEIEKSRIGTISTCVVMKGVKFIGPISTDKLTEILQSTFKKYLIKVIAEKKPVNKHDFKAMVNGIIFPSKVINIDDINVLSNKEKFMEMEHLTGNNKKDPDNFAYNYNINPFFRKTTAKIAQENEEESKQEDEIYPEI